MRAPSPDSLLGTALATRRRIASERFPLDSATQVTIGPGLEPARACADLELVTDHVVVALAYPDGEVVLRAASQPTVELARALSAWSGWLPSLRAPVERSAIRDQEIAERWAVILTEGLEELAVNHMADAELGTRCGTREWCRPPDGATGPDVLDPAHFRWRAPAIVGVVHGSRALACAGLVVEGCVHLEEVVASALLSDGHPVTQPRPCTQSLLRTIFAAGWVGSDPAGSLQTAD